MKPNYYIRWQQGRGYQGVYVARPDTHIPVNVWRESHAAAVQDCHADVRAVRNLGHAVFMVLDQEVHRA